MISSLVKTIKNRISFDDLDLLKNSAVVSASMVFASGLGFLFSIIVADAFSPAVYGRVQYAIYVANLLAIVTQPFGQHVVARFLGKNTGNCSAQNSIFANAIVIIIFLFFISLTMSIPILRWLGEFDIGIFAIFLGLTIYYLYWGTSNGLFKSGWLAVGYVGSNLLKILLVVVAVQILSLHSVTVILLIYGLSYIFPLATTLIFKPFPLKFNFGLIKKSRIIELLRFSGPVWIFQAAFALYMTIDILLLEYLTDDTTLGVYSLARTLTVIFSFVPAGVSTFLMPKIASMASEQYKPVLTKALVLSLLINCLILLVYLVMGNWLIGVTVGSEYVSDSRVFLTLAFSEIIFGIQTLISAALIGRNRVSITAYARIISVIVIAIACWLLIPLYGAWGAAAARLLSIIIAMVYFSLHVARNKLAAKVG